MCESSEVRERATFGEVEIPQQAKHKGSKAPGEGRQGKVRRLSQQKVRGGRRRRPGAESVAGAWLRGEEGLLKQRDAISFGCKSLREPWSTSSDLADGRGMGWGEMCGGKMTYCWFPGCGG